MNWVRAADHEDEKCVAADAVHVVRTALRVRGDLDDTDAKTRIIGRLAQIRFSTEARNPRGLYLMTCHESKGKEFDMVILPYVSAGIFPDANEEARQLL